MQSLALNLALQKARNQPSEVDFAFADDLLNQCISTNFALRNTQIPLSGLYGARSTMVESLTLVAITVDSVIL